MKFKVLFIVFLAVNSFVFINKINAQTAPNFSREYTFSGDGGEWNRVTFDLNTELASPSWQKVNSDAETRGETFIDSNNDSLYDRFSFERRAINTTEELGCVGIGSSGCQPASFDMGRAVCIGPFGNSSDPNCSIQVDTPFGWSATYRITGIVSLPATPSGFQIIGTGANCFLNLSWNDLRNEDSYEIERSVDGVNFSQIAALGINTTSWGDGVSSDNAYSYRIRARNAAGFSPWSQIKSKRIFCETYTLYGVGDWNNYSTRIGTELLQQGASWNVSASVNSPSIDSNNTGLSDATNNNYLDTFSARIKSSQECNTEFECIPDIFGNPLCSSFNPGAWNNDNDCIGFDPCTRVNPCWLFPCWITFCAPPLPIIPNQVDRPFSVTFSVQGFYAAYVDLKINNSDGLNLYIPDTQAIASWISENASLPCIAATIINSQSAANYGLSNLWSGNKSSIFGSEDLGVLARGGENGGSGRQYNFSLTCNNVLTSNPLTISDSVNVGVWKYPIIDNFNCNPSLIVPPQASNCSIRVRNADGGCVVSGGSFSQQVCLNESECLNNSVSLRPSQTTNFTLTCSAIDGSRSAQQNIVVSGGSGGVGGGGGGGGGIWRFFKNIIWREVIPR